MSCADIKGNINDVYSSTPWVEKYRPARFDDIVLDDINKKILLSIIENNYFPNLLLYGPPGTGKTTTIINLVNAYQEKYNQKNKGLMIHLNASDERGIDIIRNQINGFVTSRSMFGEGMKFVILDEVDYMTKNAQTALRYLLNNYNNIVNVRFCLICNYISRIDEALQTEFVRMRFNQLPESKILCFLKKINIAENLNVDEDILVSIQRHFNSDIRSMINYMQANQHLIHNCNVITNAVWENITKLFKSRVKSSIIIDKLNEISLYYNIERRNIIKNYLNYIIRHHPQYITPIFLNFIENVVHIQDCKAEYLLQYFVLKITTLIK
uniref:AAA+ ATPase domain-containing protein n=1 Tax=viral metagenome TaxID=1070528 RepID=A0A6C0EYX4_9ZZZZ